MLNKRISKKVRYIIIGSLLGISILFTSMFVQHKKIKQLEKDLYIQTEQTEQRYNYTETEIDTSSIKEKFNQEKKYELFSGTINIKHSYNYERDSILGMKSKCKLTGTANFYYQYVINLSSYKILQCTNDNIKISIDKPYLNEESCHRENNSFYRIDDECSNNILSNKNDMEKITRGWEDTFDTKGIKYIKDYYKDDYLMNKANNIVIELLRELGYKQRIQIVFN